VTLGFNPSYAAPGFSTVVGGGPARDLLSGPRRDAAEALRMGLVTRVVPDGKLEGAADELAAARRHPRGGLAATKAIVADIRAASPAAAARPTPASLPPRQGARRASPTSARRRKD